MIFFWIKTCHECLKLSHKVTRVKKDNNNKNPLRGVSPQQDLEEGSFVLEHLIKSSLTHSILLLLFTCCGCLIKVGRLQRTWIYHQFGGGEEPCQDCTLYTFTLYTVHCTLYSVHCTFYTVHCTLYTVLNALYALHSTLYTLHSTLNTLQCSMCNVRCTVYSIQYTVYSVHCTVYNVHCTEYTVQCMM